MPSSVRPIEAQRKLAALREDAKEGVALRKALIKKNILSAKDVDDEKVKRRLAARDR